MNMTSKIHEQIELLNKHHEEFNLEMEKTMIQMRFMSEVEKLMEIQNVNKKQLAERIGTSASYITQLFRGNKTLNLETVAKFQHVFGYKFGIEIKKDVTKPMSNCFTRNDFLDLFKSQPKRRREPINENDFNKPLKLTPNYSEHKIRIA